MIKIVTFSTSYTLAANESKTFTFTSGSIPTGYTFVGAFISATGNGKVFMRYANASEIGLINLNNTVVSSTAGVRALFVKNSLIG